MAEVDKAILEVLDGMALKIVLIEPGDLSLVGEILDHLEKILGDGSFAHHADLKQMAAIMKQVLEEIIMAELDDSAENYERIGECVALMQEVARNDGILKGAQRDQFCLQISSTGMCCLHAGSCPTRGHCERGAARSVLSADRQDRLFREVPGPFPRRHPG
ncbi:MAG: hypothetical protein P8130_08660 [Deltaproteobacteria bacterium]